MGDAAWNVLAIVLVAGVIAIPIWVGRRARRRIAQGHGGLEPRTAAWIAVGIELGLITVIPPALTMTSAGAGLSITLLGTVVFVPLLVGAIRAARRPEERWAAFGRSFAVTLGIQLATIYLIGGACWAIFQATGAI